MADCSSYRYIPALDHRSLAVLDAIISHYRHLTGFNTATAKRSRIVGVPPPVYSPLGASSPSMSSNAPSFNGSSGSASSSASTTPSASPQSLNAQLPSANSYIPPQQNTQQAYNTSSATSTSMSPQVYPALHLHPLNDTFIPKQISLFPPGPHNRIKIGRQTNAKTAPAPNNGYFDSKVLSRMHAEVWAEGNKVRTICIVVKSLL